jgi:4-carboxymuconolactone decarboxylase
MGTGEFATPDDSLRALASGEVLVLETLAQMQVGALERSKLDEETYLLVRLAALVATDANAVSYLAHLGAASDLDIPMAKVLGAFVAIAPVVGSARVLSAASKMAEAGLILTDIGESATNPHELPTQC